MAEKTKKPRLRFKGFTETWEQRKLGDTVQITMGQSPDGSSYSDYPSDYILIQGNADLQNGWVFPRVWTSQMTKKADAGDLIMSVRAPAGAMGKTAYNAVIGRGVAAIKGNEFIYQLLVKMDCDGYWKALSCGSTFESLNSDNIKNATIQIPNITEQEKIGRYFESIDNLITLHQRKYDKFVAIKKALLEKMFPRDEKNVPEIRFKGFTETWEQRKLGDLFTFRYGDGNTNPSNGGIYPVYGAGGIQGGYTKYNAEDSVIIGHMGDAGCVSWGEGKHYVTYNGTITTPKNDIFSSKFGYFLLLRMNLRKYRGGSGLPFLTYDMLTEMETYIPNDLQESNRIAKYLSSIDNLITLHQRQLERLKNIKSALLEKMFV